MEQAEQKDQGRKWKHYQSYNVGLLCFLQFFELKFVNYYRKIDDYASVEDCFAICGLWLWTNSILSTITMLMKVEERNKRKIFFFHISHPLFLFPTICLMCIFLQGMNTRRIEYNKNLPCLLRVLAILHLYNKEQKWLVGVIVFSYE